MPIADPRLALFMVLAATLGLAFKSVVVKLAFAAGTTVVGLLALRMVLAVPLFWAGAWLLRGRGGVGGAGRRDHAAALAAGAVFAAATLCDLAAIERIGAGLSRVILFTYPLLVVAFEALRKGQAPGLRHLVSFAISYAGLMLLIVPGMARDVDGDFLAGVGWAFGSALSYGAFLLAGQRVMVRMGSVRFAALANSGTMLTGLAVLPWLAGPGDFAYGPAALGWIAVIVVASTVVPYFLLMEGVKRLGAGRAGLVSLAGPAITVFLAWLILDETLGPVQLAGFALVMAGIAVLEGVVRLPARLRRPATG